MQVDSALERISAIHDQLARAHTCRGIKAAPVAASGLVALIAMGLQSRLIGLAPAGLAFVIYWCAVAAVGVIAASGGALYAYVAKSDRLERRRLRRAAGQFAPCVVAGGVVTALMARADAAAVAWLPGLWAMFYALGLFAARLNLPRWIGYAALYYLFAGVGLLALAPSARSFEPWGMGLAFGIGQLLAAMILHWSLHRDESR